MAHAFVGKRGFDSRRVLQAVLQLAISYVGSTRERLNFPDLNCLTKELPMLGLTPDQQAFLLKAIHTSVLLMLCLGSLWLYRHRHSLKGMLKRVLRHL